ncbi:MAG: AmmeMemoRadiSam system radical SAM enzyme [Acidobacteriota bacterium]
MAATLAEALAPHTKRALLFQEQEKGKVRCTACGHRCVVMPGRDGICKIRFNRDGVLYAPTGYVAGLQADPIEKKPFFHAYPGAIAMSFGMLGCNFHCPFCQNWISSQAPRDPDGYGSIREIAPADIVRAAVRAGARVITSTYNEPLITSEWAVEVFKEAKARGLATSYVSNGNGTPEVVEFLRRWLDLFKVDLKGFSEKGYRQLGGVLQNTLDTIRLLHEKGFWVEIVTLVVTGFNDSDRELRDIARFVASVSRDIPWHVTAFHPDYKMTDRRSTSAAALTRAASIGKEEGLRFVYAGNRPGFTENLENTYCPACHALLIERVGFSVLQNNLKNGNCPRCSAAIPGRW